MQSSTVQTVTQENFWQVYKEFKAFSFKQAWHNLKWYSVVSLANWIIVRLLFSGLMCPASIIASLLIFNAWDVGWIETLNSVFLGHVEQYTAGDVQAFLSTWLVLSGSIFVIGFVLAPWKSPVTRQIELEMDNWWRQHSDKLPVGKN